jgi:hypothetical protein
VLSRFSRIARIATDEQRNPAPALFILLQAFWVAVAVSIARNRTQEPTERIAWLLIFLFFNLPGVALYTLIAPSPGSAKQTPDEHVADIERHANQGTL